MAVPFGDNVSVCHTLFQLVDDVFVRLYDSIAGPATPPAAVAAEVRRVRSLAGPMVRAILREETRTDLDTHRRRACASALQVVAAQCLRRLSAPASLGAAADVKPSSLSSSSSWYSEQDAACAELVRTAFLAPVIALLESGQRSVQTSACLATTNVLEALAPGDVAAAAPWAVPALLASMVRAHANVHYFYLAALTVVVQKGGLAACADALPVLVPRATAMLRSGAWKARQNAAILLTALGQDAHARTAMRAYQPVLVASLRARARCRVRRARRARRRLHDVPRAPHRRAQARRLARARRAAHRRPHAPAAAARPRPAAGLHHRRHRRLPPPRQSPRHCHHHMQQHHQHRQHVQQQQRGHWRRATTASSCSCSSSSTATTATAVCGSCSPGAAGTAGAHRTARVWRRDAAHTGTPEHAPAPEHPPPDTACGPAAAAAATIGRPRLGCHGSRGRAVAARGPRRDPPCACCLCECGRAPASGAPAATATARADTPGHAASVGPRHRPRSPGTPAAPGRPPQQALASRCLTGLLPSLSTHDSRLSVYQMMTTTNSGLVAVVVFHLPPLSPSSSLLACLRGVWEGGIGEVCTCVSTRHTALTWQTSRSLLWRR